MILDVMSEDEVLAKLRAAKDDLKTQKALADKTGVDQGRVSDALNYGGRFLVDPLLDYIGVERITVYVAKKRTRKTGD